MIFYRVFKEGELFIAHLVPSVSALYAELCSFFLLFVLGFRVYVFLNSLQR